jgi:hypothetical protein
VRVEHARRAQLELDGLVAHDHGVAGVVAALVADDDRDVLREEVGGLALPSSPHWRPTITVAVIGRPDRPGRVRPRTRKNPGRRRGPG